MSYLKKVTGAHDGTVAGGPVLPCSFFENLPAVWEHLTLGQYEDGSPRQRSSLTVFFEDGLIKVCLSDRDQERTAWSSSDELVDAMRGLEQAIVQGTVQWRTNKYRNAQSRKKGG